MLDGALVSWEAFVYDPKLQVPLYRTNSVEQLKLN